MAWFRKTGSVAESAASYVSTEKQSKLNYRTQCYNTEESKAKRPMENI